MGWGSQFGSQAGGVIVTKDAERSVADVPAISECKAVAVGLENFAECLCVGPNACEYALPFGYAFLCQHPRLQEILENTKRLGPAGRVRP